MKVEKRPNLKMRSTCLARKVVESCYLTVCLVRCCVFCVLGTILIIPCVVSRVYIRITPSYSLTTLCLMGEAQKVELVSLKRVNQCEINKERMVVKKDK